MATAAGMTEAILYDVLVNYLVSMARIVESAMNRALDAITGFDSPRTSSLPGEVFLFEPRINEMEIMIDEHAIRLLRRGGFSPLAPQFAAQTECSNPSGTSSTRFMTSRD